MLLQSLERIDGALLQKLCHDGCPESSTLEFKRDLPGGSDREKHEICKDVTALANADGGDLVYGVEEKAGVAASLCPITTESADAAIRRISQVLDAGIEPRVQGLKIRHVDVAGGYALVLRVPASFDGPHCIRTNSNRRFVMRNGTGVGDMTFDQVRASFDRTATLAEQARRFIADRRQLIAARDTAVPLMAGPQLTLHLVPIAGLAGRRGVDLRPIYSREFTEFLGPDWHGASRTFNLDGLVVYPSGAGEDGHCGYNHIFRTGALEGVELGGGVREVAPRTQKPIVWSLDMSKFFYYSTKKFLDALKSWGFAGPALLGLGILNVKGYELGIGERFYGFNRATADRPHLVPADVWVEDVDSINVDNAIRPLLDTLWQAFGAERCLDFDENTGTFSPRRS